MRVLSVLRGSVGLDEFPLLRALLATGCDLINLDDRHYGFHDAPNTVARVTRRWNRAAFVRRFNEDLQRYVRSHRPQLMVLFKATHVRAAPIEQARALGCRTVCIYPDLDPTAEAPAYLDALRSVDEFLFTKPHLVDRFRSLVRPDAQPMLPLYSELEIAQPDAADPATGVSFVGHHSAGKERSLRAFQARYGARMTVVGDGWGALAAQAGPLGLDVQPALYGGVVRRIYRQSVCTLGLLMEGSSGGWGGDEVTSRSVLVPATGGVLLHPRNASAEALYGSDCPLLYERLEDAADIARRLASDPGQRLAWAAEQRRSVLQRARSAEALVRDWVR